MTEVLVIERIISLGHATKICKVLNQKKHRDAPLRIELEELDFDISNPFTSIIDKTGLIKRNLIYANYTAASKGSAYHLKVFREIQPKE